MNNQFKHYWAAVTEAPGIMVVANVFTSRPPTREEKDDLSSAMQSACRRFMQKHGAVMETASKAASERSEPVREVRS